MAYNENIPQPNDKFPQSQPQILTNFGDLRTYVEVNHVTFDAAGEGYHNFVTMPEQAADPGNIAVDQANIYTKLSTVTAQTGIFWQKEGTGAVAGDVIEITAHDLTAPGAPGNYQGYTMLAPGLKMNFGQGTFPNGDRTVPVAFKSGYGTACYAVTISTATLAGGSYQDSLIGATNVANAGFTATRIDGGHVGTGLRFSYIAIGI